MTSLYQNYVNTGKKNIHKRTSQKEGERTYRKNFQEAQRNRSYPVKKDSQSQLIF
uniref:Uncharacterized protein n=1 Tax=Rhizophora mucronata TaxID=61149 RepID=A0A2P2PMR2_RHIMU